ncbi:hypothetical protein S83_036355 [Arachis hypogaea]
MDPEAMRRCMSFGFSDKSKLAIGQCMDYGNIFVVILLFSSLFIFQFGHTDENGFKNSTMRLGADVIVFSRHLNNGILTQSIGLLSYTYMMQTQLDRIVVPMVSDVSQFYYLEGSWLFGSLIKTVLMLIYLFEVK